MSDITNFHLTDEANKVANKLVETGKFDYVVSAAKFAFAYAIKNYYETFNPAEFVQSGNNGSNYNVGSFDDLAPYVKALYPDTDTPYIYVRALINFGLIEIGKIIDRDGMPSISTLCK